MARIARKRSYTVTEVSRKPTLFKTALPFDITSNGQVIAQAIRPGGVWRTCEKCGENTLNILEYQDKHSKWHKLVLCDKCSNELL